ncbi:DNA polymerase Y family protein [Acidisoma cellulosilytica]|uniref:DNA polymerase Y family protein n=1 Tax=Acidisoma cellulosilyticum TaxID=2802395 RepID=A0A963Z4X9_9PROT|nr:DNA polymerase Y family protein [Acidisoma cellulosilyticum]MCB8881982.1 DNA polymerase Y family protein [Acidisoma cellulosilyticum]
MRRVISVYLPLWPTDRWRRQQQGRKAGQARDPAEPALAPSAAEDSNRPVITRLHDGRRHVVGAADAAARRLGVMLGQPLAEAQAMYRDLTIVDADPEGDATGLRALAAWCQRYAPLTAADLPDAIRIDSTGADHLWGGEAAMMADLHRRLSDVGLSVRMAVADTPGAAWALSHYGAETITLCPAGRVAEALHPLPIPSLRLSADTVQGLDRMGFARVGELMAAKRAPLSRRFSADLLRQLDYATGASFEPLEPQAAAQLIRERLTFVEPLVTAEAFATVIDRLSRLVSTELERRGEGARRLDLVCERVDGSQQLIALGTARPVQSAKQLARLLAERIETIDPGLGVEAMVLWVARAEPTTPAQIEAWSPQSGVAKSLGELAPLIDRLVARFGAGQVYRLAPVESDVPERGVRRIGPLAPPDGRAWPPNLPRPLRLLTPPQSVQAIALLPDQPPVAFTWRRQRHLIRRADGPERIFGEWWKRDSERTLSRDYWAVEDEAGDRFWLYRNGDGEDPETGNLAWFLHGIF